MVQSKQAKFQKNQSLERAPQSGLKNRIFGALQQTGQSLMVPVSILPAAGLLVALGRALQNSGFETESWVVALGHIFYAGGLAVFEQLPVVFAVGVAIGFSGGSGTAALSAVAGFYAFSNVLKTLSTLRALEMPLNTGVLGGILVGALAAACTRRYQNLILPPVFGFFAGKRFVPIVATAFSVLLALSMSLIWGPIQMGIHSFSQFVMGSEFGPALYAAGKRLLIPVGLHHVYYPAFLYEFGEFISSGGQVVRGDSARYFAGDVTAGRFMASEFPIMLFGLPMAALAMVLRARPDKRKAVGGMMLTAALTSMITGITEPIEFAFAFVAPILFAVHVFLAFISGLMTNALDIHLGYTFSASLIDFVLGYFNSSNASLLFFIVGPAIGGAYFLLFYGLIAALRLETPGRELEMASRGSPAAAVAQVSPVNASSGLEHRAKKILLALGGAENIEHMTACITRLRLQLINVELLNKADLKSLGAAGQMISGRSVQVVFGVESEQIRAVIQKLITQSSLDAWLSPMTGEFLSLDQVPDLTFSDRVLGDGVAVVPTEGVVVSPVDAEVSHLAETHHAVGLRSRDGVEFLIHIGIDTVQMKGEGFTPHVKQGDRVTAGQLLIEFDLDLVRSRAKSIVSPLVFLDRDQSPVSFPVAGPAQAGVVAAVLRKDLLVE